jgi:guanosine-diphosphatase
MRKFSLFVLQGRKEGLMFTFYSICEVKPCSFDGVYQPTLMDTFANGKVLLLSYFYDRVAPLIPEDASITVASIADLAKKVCRGSSSWESHWGHNEEVIEELKGRPEWCLDLTFMHGLLRLGYEFEGERQVRIGKRIDGTELGWALGATISMVLGGELTCRV